MYSMDESMKDMACQPAAPGGEVRHVRHDQEVDMHNEATREIIIGIMVDYQEGIPFSVISRKIMEMLKRRGYEPQILRCNQLMDGTYI